MASMFEHTASKIIVHIIHDETLTESNRQKLIRTAQKYSQSVEFTDISEQKKHFSDTATDLARRKCTIGSLFRFFTPEVLPDLHKVIYLDCDIVVNLDIKEMWDIDVEDYCLAGVHSKDFEVKREAFRDWLNGCSCKTFINAGVMIMNLDKMREKGNFFQNAMKWIERHIHLMLFSDQDVINNLFYGSIKLIDEKFNNCNPNTWEGLLNTIIHTPHPIYTYKTWGTKGLPPQQLYWKYYINTAWGEGLTLEDFANVMLDASAKSLSMFNHRTVEYIPVILKRLKTKFGLSTYIAITRYSVTELWYRLTHMFSSSR